MNAQMNAAIEQYNAGRQETDINLVQEVRNMMMSSGLGQAIPEAFNNNRFIVEAENKAPLAQRFLLNRYWSLQLAQSKKPSGEERYCLIHDGEVSDWLKLFQQKVLPFVIENNLPVVI